MSIELAGSDTPLHPQPKLDGSTPFEQMMTYVDEDGKRRLFPYSAKEHREILKSQAFKDFAAMFRPASQPGQPRVNACSAEQQGIVPESPWGAQVRDS